MPTTKQITEPFFRRTAHAPLNIAPERGPQLAEEIFGSGRWDLLPSETEANFYAVPADKAIYLSYAGLASLWCVAYAAYHAADIASRSQRQPTAGRTEIDIGAESAERKISAHVAYAKLLFRTDRDWPEDLPAPAPEADFSSPAGRVNNVFYGALSWIMLHEIAHVHQQHSALIPAHLRVRQEFQADDFATRWILDDAGNGLYREFRVLMIVVALTWLFLHEDTVGIGKDHPATILRFRDAGALFKMGDRSAGLENAGYVLKALLDPATPAPSFNTSTEVFEWISDRLEILFPAA
ncbi:phage exclusion protein Lit family protein [Dongia sp.]|uniref:phage exclusion protein Lit family protein n=1 Tax=Dongia sp. TaxID=1977262 RepID=UPI0035B1FC37